MTELEIREKLINLKNELRAVIENGKAEKRELNDDENSKLVSIRTEIDSLNAELKQLEETNTNLVKEKEIENNNVEKTIKRMKLINLVNDVVNNRAFDEDVQASLNEARSEMSKSGISAKGQIVLRTINASTTAEGGANVPEDKMGIELALRNRLIATRMGATWLGGLVGDVSIPTYAGSNVAWKGETAAADSGDTSWGEVVLSPKRLTAYVDVSKQFLLQDSNDAEGMLINDLADAIAEKLDKTIFSDATGATQPAGLLADSATTETQDSAHTIADVTYKDILGIEEKLEEKNATNFMFIANPSVKFALKGIQMANGLDMVWQEGEVDGYKAESSNSVKANSLVCIDPRALVIGQWGGIDITVDPYTKAADGCVRLVVNAYFDFKMKANRIHNVIFNPVA